MDVLNKAFGQIKELYLQLTPGSRVIAVLLAGVLVVSLGYLFVQGLPSQSSVYLFDNEVLPSNDIRRMDAALGAAGLNDYEIEGGRIRVPKSQKAQHLGALAEGNALPMNFSDILAGALKNDSPWVTKEQREAIFKQAKTQLLERILSKMKGVEQVAVVYDKETKPGFLQEKVHTATVNVWADGGLPVEPHMVTAIVNTMTHAIAGLQSQNVSVIDGNSGQTFVDNDNDGFTGPGGPYQAAARAEEADWETKIKDHLSYIPGVLVGVGVKLNEYVEKDVVEVKHDKTTTVHVQESSLSKTREGADKAGAPGYQAQDNQPREKLAGNQVIQGEREEETLDESDITSIVPGRHETSKMAGLTPTLVRASVLVPSTYILGIWRQKNPAPAGEPPQTPDQNVLDAFRIQEFNKIQQQVANFIVNAEGITDKATLVEVDEYEPMASPPPPAPTYGEAVSTWWATNWTTVGLFGLIAVSLIMMWSMLRERPPAQAAPEEEETVMTDLPQRQPGEEPVSDEETADEIARQLPGFDKKQLSLKEELSSLVAENPEAAANVLRQWIGNVSANA